MKHLLLGCSIASCAVVAGCGLFDDEKPQVASKCPLSGAPLVQDVASNGLDGKGVLDWAQQSQGSRLIPKSWFDALERPEGEGGSFADSVHLAGYGLITDEALAYPVGMALDCQDESALSKTRLSWYEGQAEAVDQQSGAAPEAWIGLNCAACHSGQITVGGRTTLVPGAPARFDYQSFVENLDEAVEQTLPDADQTRFDRFAAAVFAASNTPDNEANRGRLTTALRQWLAWQKLTEQRNFPQGDARPRYGYSRVDAFGHIYNKITMFAGAEGVSNPSTAPVSYPFLWGIQDQSFVQWNGRVANARLANPVPVGNDELVDYGALGRNAGEVLGVFGDLAVEQRQGQRPSYTSSVRVNNLMRLEELVGQLIAPKLADFVSEPFDQARVDAGKDLFAAKCASCHFDSGQRNTGGGTEVNVNFATMRTGGNLTDMGMACNAMLYKSPSAMMVGTKTELVGGRQLEGEEPVGTMLEVAVKGVMARNISVLADEVLRNLWGVNAGFDEPVLTEGARSIESICRDKIDTPEGRVALQYKARPLDGIWATGPYLHNGSVRTLYQLLLPPAQRERTFWVGSTEFDEEDVGFVSRPSTDGSTFRFDTSEPGNSNMGHVYGANGFTEEQRRALVAYMKSL